MIGGGFWPKNPRNLHASCRNGLAHIKIAASSSSPLSLLEGATRPRATRLASATAASLSAQPCRTPRVSSKLGAIAIGRHRHDPLGQLNERNMVRTATLALSGAALVATASSFMVPPLLGSPRPTVGAFSSSARAEKLSPETAAGSSRLGRRGRGSAGARMMMSTVPKDGAAAAAGGGGSTSRAEGERYYGPTSKPLLDSVHSPADMKRFTIAELKQLAYELRWETLEVGVCTKRWKSVCLFGGAERVSVRVRAGTATASLSQPGQACRSRAGTRG